jgi:hypothetical protein
MVEIDPLKRYFLISFRSNNTKPEEFGLRKAEKEGEFFYPKDKSFWVQRNLYDFGWGKEYGFVRLPELGFEELWYLVSFSSIQENRYGAAAEIERQYTEELLAKVYPIISDPNYLYKKEFNDTLIVLGLDRPFNRSQILGKSKEQINEDHEKWIKISNIIKE